MTVVCVWFPSQFQYQRRNKLYQKNKAEWCIFFLNYWIISFAGSPVASEIFALGKILQLLLLSADHRARWPLCNRLWEHRFSVPDLVSSPPPPAPAPPGGGICFGTWKKIYMLTKWLHSSYPSIIACTNCIAVNRLQKRTSPQFFVDKQLEKPNPIYNVWHYNLGQWPHERPYTIGNVLQSLLFPQCWLRKWVHSAQKTIP